MKIHVAEGDTVTVGQVLAEIATDERRERGARRRCRAERRVPPPSRAEAPPRPDRRRDRRDPRHRHARRRRVGHRGHDPRVVVKVGDAVEDGQTIVEISTDKVDMELPSPPAGTITEILAEEGDTVTVGQVIARLQVGRGRRHARTPAAVGQRRRRGRAGTGTRRSSRRRQDLPRRRAAWPPSRASTSARVAGTGPGGRITKADVLGRIGNGARSGRRRHAAPAAAPAGADGSSPLRRAARRCSPVHGREPLDPDGDLVPHAHRHGDGHPPQAAEGRRARRSPSPTSSPTPSPRPRPHDMPVMAHHFDNSDGKPHRVDDGQVNLGIAVDVEKKDGTRTLMVPVIRDAGRKNFADFKAAFDELIEKARDEHADRRRPHGREHLAHQPGRDRHHRLRPAAHGRPGHDRRHRLDRLPGGPRRTSAP